MQYDLLSELQAHLRSKLANKEFTDSRFGSTIELLDVHFDATDITDIVPNADFMVDEPSWYETHYLPLIKEQLSTAIRLLRDDTNTRQAILNFSSRYSYLTTDYPCTQYVSILLRSGVLYYNVHMRSSDISHYHNDRQFHLLIINAIQKEVNFSRYKILWNADSLHIYEPDFNKIS